MKSPLDLAGDFISHQSMENETWKPIPSIAGALASSFGRVLMPARENVPMPMGGSRNYTTRPIFGSEEKTATGRAESRRRYIMRWRGKTYKVHILVCEAFHGPKPTPLSIVMHLDEDPSNNRPENLRWGTRKENQNFPKAQAAFRARTGENSPWAIHKRKATP